MRSFMLRRRRLILRPSDSASGSGTAAPAAPCRHCPKAAPISQPGKVSAPRGRPHWGAQHPPPSPASAPIPLAPPECGSRDRRAFLLLKPHVSRPRLGMSAALNLRADMGEVLSAAGSAERGMKQFPCTAPGLRPSERPRLGLLHSATCSASSRAAKGSAIPGITAKPLVLLPSPPAAPALRCASERPQCHARPRGLHLGTGLWDAVGAAAPKAALQQSWVPLRPTAPRPEHPVGQQHPERCSLPSAPHAAPMQRCTREGEAEKGSLPLPLAVKLWVKAAVALPDFLHKLRGQKL